MCGWQVTLCYPFVTHGSYLSTLEIKRGLYIKCYINLSAYFTPHVDELATEPFCCCTASMEQATNGAETAGIDGLVSSRSENIFVLFCLQAPGYGLTL